MLSFFKMIVLIKYIQSQNPVRIGMSTPASLFAAIAFDFCTAGLLWAEAEWCRKQLLKGISVLRKEHNRKPLRQNEAILSRTYFRKESMKALASELRS